MCFLAAGALSLQSAAVPIPWKNCGTPGDLLSITQSDASVWPPAAAAPASAVATFDTAGNLLNLRINLLHGLPWTFDSGPLPVTASAGFVSLPASFPVTLTSPALPVPAGPYSTTQTFCYDTQQVTIHSRANLAARVDGPVTTTASLAFQGKPGFPLTPAAGDAYATHIQMTELDGTRVFCMDVTEPFKTAVPFVTAQFVESTPTLSRVGEVMLGLMVAALGLFMARRQRPPGRHAISSRSADWLKPVSRRTLFASAFPSSNSARRRRISSGVKRSTLQ